MSNRLVALMRESHEPPKVGHFSGMPPGLISEKDSRQQLPQPRVLLIESKKEGTFLTRYGPDGVFAGDTWHQCVEDAMGQAEYEYGDLIGRWHEIPPETTDPFAFALKLN